MLLNTIGVLKLVLLQYLVASASAVASRRHTDTLLIARCRSKCTNTNDRMTCESSCVRNYLENSSYKKYGDCPKDPLNRLETVCLNTCQSIDYHCPGVQKCCAHSCGMSCLAPVGLEKIRGPPNIPTHVQIREPNRGFRVAQVHWEAGPIDEQLSSSATFYVVESRHHIGISFAERKLENDWQNHPLTVVTEVKTLGRKKYVGEMKLKPGRWYQVRVAAVNEHGTRGYSAVSREFQLSKKPNPPQPPKNLTMGPLVPSANGTYTRKVMWMLPRSDLPVEKYKISWSLYLNGSNALRSGNSSLFKETATVSAPTRHYEIRGLQPNSIYYLQIHAISVYGKKRLKSAATNELMDTTLEVGGTAATPPSMDNMLMNDASYHRRTKSGPSAQAALSFRFVASKTGLAVRLNWSNKTSPNARFRLHLCRGARDCLSKPTGSSWQDVVVKQKTSYEFARLEFDTKYTVGLKHNRKRHQAGSGARGNGTGGEVAAGYDSVRTFVTPKCEQFRKEHPEVQLECAV